MFDNNIDYSLWQNWARIQLTLSLQVPQLYHRLLYLNITARIFVFVCNFQFLFRYSTHFMYIARSYTFFGMLIYTF